MHLIVLIEDSPAGQLLERSAVAAGHTVIRTGDSVTFRTAYKTQVPDAVVMDMLRAGADSLEQLEYLADQGFENALILVASRDLQENNLAQVAARGLGLRMTAMLEGPADIRSINEAMNRLAARSLPPTPDRLWQAIRAGELVLEYQPIVTCRTRTLGKLEALVRWQHPDLGFLKPAAFVPMAEESPDIMAGMTDWVITTAIRDHKALRMAGIAVPIAVNVSPRVTGRDLPDRLEQMLCAGGMPPDQLCLEITETTAFQNPVETMEILSRIRLKGMQLAIDDFGTGYSSLKLLRELPFTAIKIDRSFVLDLTTSRDSRAIVSSIIALARNMDLESIAEGVETEEAARLLESMGVDKLQGYLIAHSMPLDDIIEIFSGRQKRQAADAQPAAPAHEATTEELVALRLSLLSPRQQEVMRLLAEGCTVKQIATRLELGLGTIKTHMSMAYSILGAHNRIEALRIAGLAAERTRV